MFVCAGKICPERCTCKNRAVSCVAKHLRTVPDNLPHDVSKLILSDNVIERLTNIDFVGCHLLVELHLGENRIQDIQSNTFNSTPRLNNLVLRINKLRYSSLPVDAFAGLKNLQFLDLSYNFGNESVHYNGPLFVQLTNLFYLAIDGIRGVTFPIELSRLQKLKNLRIYGQLDTVTNSTFEKLNRSTITTLYINAYTSLQTLEPQSFMYLTQLKELRLCYNEMLGLKNASRAWYGLQFTKIKILNLSGMTSFDEDEVAVEDDFFNFLEHTKIETLLLNGNYITRIAPRFAASLRYLTLLNLNDNRLSAGVDRLIDDLAKLPELRYLLVQRQLPASTPYGISHVGRNIQKAINDETIRTDERHVDGANDNFPPIQQCRSHVWLKCPQADLTFISSAIRQSDKVINRFEKHQRPICFAIPPKLIHAALDEAIATESHILPQVVITGGKNLKALRLGMNGLQRIEGPIYFTEPVTNISIDLKDNQISCLAPQLFRNSSMNGSYIGELNLAGNRLADQLRGDKTGVIFQYYERLSKLNLSRNAIKTLNHRTFEKLPNLRILDLSMNSLRTIEFKFDHMSRLQYLDLSDNLIADLNDSLRMTFSTMFKANGSKLKLNLNGNPLQCSCQTLNFLQWLQLNRHQMNTFGTYTCLYSNTYVAFSRLSDYILVDLAYECSTKTAVIVSGSLLGLVLLLVAVSACCYRHRWEIRYACLKWTRQGQRYQQIVDRPLHYEYDAFVIYDSGDRNWVNDHLVPHLEERHLADMNDESLRDDSVNGFSNRLRLCVHERDFPPGHEIIGNIWSRMERSRKVILVVSRNFTESYYCDYEMNLARMQSVEQGRNVIVPILLELPDVEKVSDCLHWILRKLTYLEWPQNEGEQDEFWQRLQDVLSNDGGDSLFSR